ncbi:MAG: ATP synthase F1 subunit delta, partial [Bacteroidota bacterium]
MSVTRIASRYAKSLIDLAIEQDKLERVKGDIESFQKAIDNRDYYLLLKSPIINPSKKLSIADALFKNGFDELTMAFIRIITNKGRESYLPEIAAEFVKQYRAHKHISTVKLTTASPLTEETLGKIKQSLMSSSATDDNVEIETTVDPSIMGGFVIEFDDKLYDSSVAHKLELLRKEFS